jgi:hypothetical protein
MPISSLSRKRNAAPATMRERSAPSCRIARTTAVAQPTFQTTGVVASPHTTPLHAGNATASDTESITTSTLIAASGATPPPNQQSAKQPRRSPRIAKIREGQVIDVDSQTETGITVGVEEQYLLAQVARWNSDERLEADEIDFENNPYASRMEDKISDRDLVHMLMIKVLRKKKMDGKTVSELAKNEKGQQMWLCLICKKKMPNRARGYQNLAQHLCAKKCCGGLLHAKFRYFQRKDMNHAIESESKRQGINTKDKATGLHRYWEFVENPEAKNIFMWIRYIVFKYHPISCTNDPITLELVKMEAIDPRTAKKWIMRLSMALSC